jgi:hypothetical protein
VIGSVCERCVHEPKETSVETDVDLLAAVASVDALAASSDPQVQFTVGAIANGADDSRPAVTSAPSHSGLSPIMFALRYEDIFGNEFRDKIYSALSNVVESDP